MSSFLRAVKEMDTDVPLFILAALASQLYLALAGPRDEQEESPRPKPKRSSSGASLASKRTGSAVTLAAGMSPLEPATPAEKDEGGRWTVLDGEGESEGKTVGLEEEEDGDESDQGLVIYTKPECLAETSFEAEPFSPTLAAWE
ncbi:hypothetical protein DFJ74DRAFT_708275 [Hyaloraphidium curvatum]|nr:hypothetical protein DFJ74DRAFT_708275 [Hyaloraphidium curvatum]